MKIIGISARTTNKDGQAAADLEKLWQKFTAENIVDKIENKTSSDIYCVYTDYKSDYTEDYTVLIGPEVSDFENIPDGLLGREFPEQKFKKFVAKGEMPNAVMETWQTIWNNDSALNRAYTYDYERYTEKSFQKENAEVEIFVAVK